MEVIASLKYNEKQLAVLNTPWRVCCISELFVVKKKNSKVENCWLLGTDM